MIRRGSLQLTGDIVAVKHLVAQLVSVRKEEDLETESDQPRNDAGHALGAGRLNVIAKVDGGPPLGHG